MKKYVLNFYIFIFFSVLTYSLFAEEGIKSHDTYLGLGYGYDIAFKNATFDGIAGNKAKQTHVLSLVSETYFNNTPFGLYASIGTGKTEYMKIKTENNNIGSNLFLSDFFLDSALGATVKYGKKWLTLSCATSLCAQYGSFMFLYTETSNQKFYSETFLKIGLEALLDAKIHTGEKWFFSFGLIGRWNFLDVIYPANTPPLFSKETLKTSFNIRPRISSGFVL